MAEIRWLGHNCFRIRSKEATVITDPVGKKTGYTLAKQTADIVTISHDHPGHTNLAAIKPEFQVIDGPGEYEVHGVFIEGLRTYHDKEKGASHGYNTVYHLEFGGLTYAHLGDLGHPLSDEQIESLSNVDILFAPAGGGPLLSASDMAEVVGAISPRMLIPMQFRTPKGDQSREPIEPFAKHLGIEMPSVVDKVTVKASDLTDQMQFIVLKPEG
ncbi:MAG TPA: MBL fold metallo-hydrolase [Thermomicrobiales bacterium]|nr:MBL fold metallo-hydrolase [Thermomicrobiales bacterium]